MKTLLAITAVLALTGCTVFTDQIATLQGAKSSCERHGNDWPGMHESWQQLCKKRGWDKLSHRDPPQDYFDKQKMALRKQVNA